MNFNLTWLDKFTKLHQLDPNVALKIHMVTNEWYVSSQLQLVHENGLIESIGAKCHGKSPEQAVVNFWTKAIDNAEIDSRIVVGLSDKTGYKWQGSKWIKA